MTHRTLAFALVCLGCSNTVPDARWTFTCHTPEGDTRDTWTDRRKTCAQSRDNAENLAAIQHKSHAEVCARNRRDGGAPEVQAWLRCEAAITLRSARCEDQQRRVPRPFWIRLH